MDTNKLNHSGDSEILKLIDEVRGMDRHSPEFIFDPKYAEIRSFPCETGPGDSLRTRLSLLLHEQMTADHRRKIFPRRFDLGSHRGLLKSECTYKSLFAELYSDKDRKPFVADPFEPIKDHIKRLTGRSVQYFMKIDKANTLKVVKTLYQFTKKIDRSIFSALSAPENGKSGLEFRYFYHHVKTKKLNFKVADIREYLGAELPTERIIEISNVFPWLQSICEVAEIQIEKTLFSAHQYSFPDLLSAFDRLIASIETFQVDLPNEPKLRLDETLYLYISSLEFRHFAQMRSKINETGAIMLNITPIIQKIRELAHSILPADTHLNPSSLNPEAFKYDVVDISRLPESLNKGIHSLMEHAFSRTIKDGTVSQLSPLVESLLSRVLLFRVGESRASLPEIVAAFCAIHSEQLQRTNHMPYWHGQPAVGDSLLEALKLEYSDDSVYEEHMQIWRIRLVSYWYAIWGQSERNHRKLKLNSLLMKRAAEIARMPTTEAITRLTRSFFDHIDAQLLLLSSEKMP